MNAILWTISYFDIFDYPLTNFEVFKWLYHDKKNGFFEIQRELEELVILGKLEVKDGFYFLPGRGRIINQRKINFQISKAKLDKARGIAKLLAHLPFLRGIFVCNKVAQGTADEDSDIDLFIVAKTGKIWTTRFLTLLYLKIFGLRPKITKKRDKFCLCFYVTDNRMSLEDYLLPEAQNIPDIHFIYWLSAFLPLYNGGAILNFIKANDWIKKYLPNFEFTDESSLSFSGDFIIKKFLEKILSSQIFENSARALQFKIMPEHLRAAAKERGTNVIISDDVLKLHLNDRRESYRDKFIAAVSGLSTDNTSPENHPKLREFSKNKMHELF